MPSKVPPPASQASSGSGGKKGLATAAEAAALFKAKFAKEKANSCRYKAETYMVVSRWTADTKLKYGPNPKRGKSAPRYEKYSKAKTVGEAIELGSFPPDLLFDYERGFYKIIGGPMRDEPVDVHRAKAEGREVTKTDEILGKWFLFELCKTLGVSRATLVKESTYAESATMRALRLLSDKEAETILAEVAKEKRAVTNHEVLRVLRKWSFVKNSTRLNVMKEGETFVNSDTVGLSSGRDGVFHVQKSSLSYPNVMKVLTQYIRDRQPAELKAQFHFTSINMNFGYGAVRHRDGNNIGLSMLAGFGDYTGGELRYFSDDDKTVSKLELQKLDVKHSANVDVRTNTLLFDGQRCHEVLPFEGERYTLVWFTCARYWKAGEENLKKIVELGFEMPSEKSVTTVHNALRKPTGGAEPKTASKPGFMQWPCDGVKDANIEGSKKRAGPSTEENAKRRRQGGA